MNDSVQIHYRACHLCEAICGLEIKTLGKEIISIKGDSEDPLSKGYICPKATALEDLHKDPDRLKNPVKKTVDDKGVVKWQTIKWDRAITEVAERIVAVQNQHGLNSVGFYAGNPGVHNYGNMTHGGLLRKAVGTKNHFSATSLDQLPHHLAGLLMYGHQMFVPIADIDNCELLIIIGGNPLASNGSMMTMPDARGRLKDLAKRGKLIVIDPRRTETAAIASEHFFIKPGSDAFLLLAMVNYLIDKDLCRISETQHYLEGFESLRKAARPFTLTLAEAQTGISANAIKNLAEQITREPKSAIYGRMGVSVQPFGGLCQWAIQLLNILSGSADKEGGVRLTSPAFAAIHPKARQKGNFNRYQSRVSGLPEFAGEFPAVAMAEEILTPGEGQIRAMFTIAGNPLASSAEADTLEKAFKDLDFYVAFDFYINETTSNADIILPPTGPLEHDHFDIAFHRFSVRNTVRMNEPVFDKPEGSLHDWEIFNLLSAKIAELKGESFKPLPPPDQLIALGIENDMWGAKHNPKSSLSLDMVRQYPHGMDLGPLQQGFFQRLCTDDQKIDLAPEFYLNDLPRLLSGAESKNNEGFEYLLIGRRHVRSNNSWMHNYQRLVKGKPRWHLLMNPKDMAKLKIEDGSKVNVSSRTGNITTIVEASEDIMPGVVCLPHGWGQQNKNVRLSVASQQGGANYNQLTDASFIDRLSGNAALNAVPVAVKLAI